jgi:hypothetical protein
VVGSIQQLPRSDGAFFCCGGRCRLLDRRAGDADGEANFVDRVDGPKRQPSLDTRGTSRAIDLRTLARHPLASVGALVLGLRCSWCPGTAPMPKLLGLYALPPAKRQGAAL